MESIQTSAKRKHRGAVKSIPSFSTKALGEDQSLLMWLEGLFSQLPQG